MAIIRPRTSTGERADITHAYEPCVVAYVGNNGGSATEPASVTERTLTLDPLAI